VGFPLSFSQRGQAQIIDYVLFKYKDLFFCEQVKNKPCMVNSIMCLIPWKRSRGSETLITPRASPVTSGNWEEEYI
jgi:hypothetical protein